MKANILIALIGIVYIFDVFLLTWISGRIAGIQSFSFSKIGNIGLGVILFSWLSLTAFVHVPMMVKPLILVVSAGVTVYIFIVMLETQPLRAMIAGAFFIVCQFTVIVFLIKELWDKNFFQIIKFILFQYY